MEARRKVEEEKKRKQELRDKEHADKLQTDLDNANTKIAQQVSNICADRVIFTFITCIYVMWCNLFVAIQVETLNTCFLNLNIYLGTYGKHHILGLLNRQI